MKIAINKCWGGFSVSPLATKEIAKRKGKNCYFFKGGLSENYTPITIEQAEKEFMWSALSIKNPKKYLRDSKNWHEMTLNERQRSNEKHKSVSLYYRDLPRDDKDLIAVIEELGKKANGSHAELRIIEIPDGIKYIIDEYDGMESIHEEHQTWG